MRNFGYILGLFAAIFIGSTSFGQDEVEKKDGAVIEMDKDVHDFGTFTQGDTAAATCTFVITNTGNEPLILSRCKPACGCTFPVCPKAPIAPGKSVTITVKYDANRVGPINKSVTIMSNAVNEPNKVIRIKGNIKAKAVENAPAK